MEQTLRTDAQRDAARRNEAKSNAPLNPNSAQNAVKSGIDSPNPLLECLGESRAEVRMERVACQGAAALTATPKPTSAASDLKQTRETIPTAAEILDEMIPRTNLRNKPENPQPIETTQAPAEDPPRAIPKSQPSLASESHAAAHPFSAPLRLGVNQNEQS